MEIKTYQFDIIDAQKYGVDEAIMLNNLRFWIAKNKANNKNFYDGKYWTYNSTKAFTELFPFWTEKQIKRIIKSLINQNAIIVGNYNDSIFDKTRWFALNDISPVGPNGPMTSYQMGRPIPYNKPYNKHNSKSLTSSSKMPQLKLAVDNTKINPCSIKQDCITLIETLNENSGFNYRKVESNFDIIKPRLKEHSLSDLVEMIKYMCKKWKNDSKMKTYLRPSTLFRRSNCENYVTESKMQNKSIINELGEDISEELKQLVEKKYQWMLNYYDGNEELMRTKGHTRKHILDNIKMMIKMGENPWET